MPDKKRKSGPGLAESVKMDKFMVLKNSITGRLISVKALVVISRKRVMQTRASASRSSSRLGNDQRDYGRV